MYTVQASMLGKNYVPSCIFQTVFMLPLKLSLKGIYSYRSLQVIEFDRLLEAKLFGIFGAVGAGKSTILEAMTFALYENVERLQKNDNRAYNMLNLQSDELLVDFEFMAGIPEQKYRIVVEGKRHPKKFDKVDSFKRRCFVEQNQEWVPMEDFKAKDVLGLSLENFRRTIIIPQGKFEEFLKLGSSDRSEMMKELFNLNRFDLTDEVKQLKWQNEKNMSALVGNLNPYEQVDEAALALLEGQLQAASSQLAQQKDSQQGLEKQVSQLTEAAKLYQAINALEQESNTLGQEAAEVQDREAKLQRFEAYKARFDADFKLREVALNDKQQNTQQLEQVSTKIQAAQSGLQNLQAPFELAQKAYENLDTKKQVLKDWQTVFEMKKAAYELEQAKLKLEQVQQEYQAQQSKLTEAEQSVQALKQQVQNIQDNAPDSQLLLQIQAWKNTDSTLQSQIKQLEEGIATERKQLEQSTQSLQNLLTTQLELSVSEDYHSWLKSVNQLAAESQAAQKTLSDKLQHWNMHQALANLSNSLQAGDNCPVCGSTEHPQKMQAPGEVSDLQQALQATEAKLKQITALQVKIEAFMPQADSWQLSIQAKQENLQQQTQMQAQHRAAFNFKGFDAQDPQLLERIGETLNQHQNQLKTAQQQLVQAEDNEKTARQGQDKAQQELAQTQQAIAGLEASYSTKADGIVQLQSADYANVLGNEIQKQRIPNLEAEISQIQQNWTDLQQRQAQLKQQLDTAQGQQESLQQQAQSIELKLTELEAKISQALAQEGIGEAEVIACLAWAIDPVSERQYIQRWQQDWTRVQTQLSSLKAQQKDMPYEAGALETVQAHLQTVSAEVSRLSERVVLLQADLSRYQADLQKKLALQAQLAELDIRHKNLGTLESMFRANGFVKFISTVYLENLCHNANERFMKLSRGTLSLSLNENNDFEVVDAFNEGRRRSVKTLSGGQTFQAALCLALALAESIRQQAGAQQSFFFLDEGLGSLDEDALQIVFDTLKALRNEHRAVGLISHVGALHKEIDVYLKVTNSEEKGSEIVINY